MELGIINVITNVIYIGWKPYTVKVIREGYLVSPQNPLPWVNVTFMPPAVPSFSLQFVQLTKLSIMVITSGMATITEIVKGLWERNAVGIFFLVSEHSTPWKKYTARAIAAIRKHQIA